MSKRPSVRELFLSELRRLEVFFYTSNLPKFLQAKTFFDASGLVLHHFKTRTDPYNEDYSFGKKRLLAMAIKEILGSVGHRSIFFVEDTSLRIEALSGVDDFPGLAVKEWFEKTTFLALDQQLRDVAKNRSATVKSDIALHIPALKRPVYFHGMTSGHVANTPPAFNESREYPWLTPHTFNGWFIPEGHEKRLGEMSLEESWECDFRIKAFAEMAERLEEYAAILNLPPHAYSRRRREFTAMPSLFPEERSLYMVVGKTCAGKTAFGLYASQRRNLRFIEASAVLRTFRNEYDDFDVDGFELAERLLRIKGPDVVARKILELYAPFEQDIVITGFRTIEEVEVVRKEFPQAQVVLIEASERTRYHRHLTRKRSQSGMSFTDFVGYDEQQWRFGLLRVAESFADIKLTNEGSLEDYHKQIDAVIGKADLRNVQGIATQLYPRHNAETNQLYRCLRSLAAANRPLTCHEIEQTSKEPGKIVIRHNNVNKVLKRVPELAERLETEGMPLRYRISDAGRAYVRLMEPGARTSIPS